MVWRGWNLKRKLLVGTNMDGQKLYQPLENKRLDTQNPLQTITPEKANMTMEDLSFEDLFPIENGGVPMSC